ncbi:sensor histidine kinase [Emticicia fluvialis]|uniref:sensor histidine kinase n=1 Tax=Emticicia fluvialis TaxID=2974474 RepID=UPI002165DFF1|nr:HAMP domain-containing sensor histidine kinase [Emticicia fluvialis]
MDWKLFKKPILLILSIVFALAAAFNSLFVETDPTRLAQEYYANGVRENLKAQIQISDEELQRVSINYRQKPMGKFQSPGQTTYPYYIFSNGKLVYWSDQDFVPDYQRLDRNAANSLLNSRNHKFIVNTYRFDDNGKKIEIFSLINLYQKSPNQSINYNNRIFANRPAKLSDLPSSVLYLNIRDGNGHFLFSIAPALARHDGIPFVSGNTVLMVIASLALLGLLVILFIHDFHSNRQYGRAFLLLAAYLIFVRLAMLSNGVLYAVYETEYFNPKYLTISPWVPSMGNALLDTLVCFILAGYLTMYFYRSENYYRLTKAPAFFKHVFSVAVAGASVLSTFLFYRNLCSIYEKSMFTIDLTLAASFSSFKIAALVLYLASSIVFFLINHLLISIFLRLNKDFVQGAIKWVFGVLTGLLIISFLDEFHWVYLLGGVYFIFVYAARLPRFFYKFTFRTNLYFGTGAFVSAAIAMFVVFDCEQDKDFFVKQKIAQRYLTDNNVLGAHVLTDLVTALNRDSAIEQLMKSTNPAFGVQKVLEDRYWNEYLNRYEADVLIFDSRGNPLGPDKTAPVLDFYKEKFAKAQFKTQNPSVFFIDKTASNDVPHYVVFIPVGKTASLSGVVVLELIPKDDFEQGAYPDWMVDERFASIAEAKNYSYAIFDRQNKLIFNSGDFNYSISLPDSLLNMNRLYEKGIIINNYKHVGKSGKSGYKVVISSDYHLWNHLLTNFSFLFLLSVWCTVIVMIIYALKYSIRKYKAGFSAKMQLYLNVVFLLPLALLVITTVIILEENSEINQEKAFLDSTVNISSIIESRLKSLAQEDGSKATLKQEISKLAHDAQLDINLYNPDGRLSFSTLPLIYEEGFVSDYINPVAYRNILNDKENGIVLPERLSNRNYKTAYAIVKEQDGHTLGIIGVPFFDADSVLSQQVQKVVGSILIVATILLFLLLLISYLVSGLLMKPLKIVVDKLKVSNAGKSVKRLEWSSDDEIGLVVREYNKVIKKLEDNKTALSLSQKQTAWREMAKQVAHEIKNPLTPMKLSIQQLQRTLVIDSPRARERIERTLDSLTEQIDNISEIANSFSEFAKMPVPRSEIFDLVSLVQKSADLYAEDDKIALNAYIRESEALVIGDRQFMSRVITNLIINGIQSVPFGKRPIINLRLYKTEDDKVIIEIQDNGAGIAEKHHEKVFRPNFTTKVGGSGFGLAMARRGVEHAGGNIWFETENNRGTTFFIDLPLAPSL